jgi:hypothetical protein
VRTRTCPSTFSAKLWAVALTVKVPPASTEEGEAPAATTVSGDVGYIVRWPAPLPSSL